MKCWEVLEGLHNWRLLEKLKAAPPVKRFPVFSKIYMCLIKHHAMKTYGEVK
jgi:hypothetical protein